MTEILDNIVNFVTWLFYTSLKATIVIALILIAQIIFRKRLSAKWQHALWFLLIARLLIPVDIPMPFSVFNLTRNVEPVITPLGSSRGESTEISKSSASSTALNTSFSGYPPITVSDVRIIPSPKVTWSQIAGMGWVMVTFALLIYTLSVNLALRRRIHKAEDLSDPELVNILNGCKKRLGIQQNIQLVSMKNITSPFWYGIVKPKIILPALLLIPMDNDKIEHIFMHELVHYKQKDVPLAIVATLLQILHWFNPFIWMAFFKMRADRELACDELVLTSIGKDKNKQYGRTLISLIESASQRGLLPVAVGLADTKFNMKRRVTMITNFSPKSIWWTAMALLLISTIAAFALTGAQSSATLSGHITFQGGEQPDSIHVGVYRLMPHDWVVLDFIADPFQFFTLSKGTYSFDVDPGCYTLAAWAFGYERAFVEIIVPDDDSRININFDLAPKSLPGPVTSVKLIGEFCDWNPDTAMEMRQTGNQWVFSEPDLLAKGSQFKFMVSGTRRVPASESEKHYINMFRYFPGNSKIQIVKDYATFNHVHDGGDIRFDPSVYTLSEGKAKITVKGFDLYHQFAALQDSLRVFEAYYHDVRREYESTPSEETKEAFSILKARFERLETEFDPFFAPIFHEYWLGNLLGFHPSRIELWELVQTGERDSTILEQFLDTSTFVDYFKSLVDRLENIDPNSVLIDGHLWEGLHYIHMYSKWFPTLKERIGVSEDYEFEYVLDFSEKTHNPEAKESLLYHMADTYASEPPYDFDKARILINEFYNEFPQSWYIEYGSAEKIRNRLKLQEGQPAPFFTVKTLDGERIRLSTLKGKFVFLEFWGSNCGPCRGESPHMIRLSQAVSPDSLVLIGLGHADEEKAREFVASQKLPYANAVAPDNVLKDYGITYYPATYLIDPDGTIIGRDMRGDALTEDVRKKMRLYAEK